MARLKDMDIKLISLVRAGANKKSIIYKDDEFREIFGVKFAKSDVELGVVYGIVYAPNDIDTQGDSASADEIRKAAYNFMQKSNVYTIDVEHDMTPINAYICESWIVKKGDAFFGECPGAWAVGIKIEDENLRKAVKNGEINGLSMYGSGVIEDEPKITRKSIVELVKEVAGSLFQHKGEEMNEETIKMIVKSAIDDAGAKFEEGLKELKKKIDFIEEAIQKSKQNNEPKTVEKSATGGIL